MQTTARSRRSQAARRRREPPAGYPVCSSSGSAAGRVASGAANTVCRPETRQRCKQNSRELSGLQF